MSLDDVLILLPKSWIRKELIANLALLEESFLEARHAAMKQSRKNEIPPEPTTYTQAVNSEYSDLWDSAMSLEFWTVSDIGTFVLTDLTDVPEGKQIIPNVV